MKDIPEFMSIEHVNIMNQHAASSQDVMQLCSQMKRDYLWVQEMQEGEHIHYWQLHFTRENGFFFKLGPPESTPDLVQRGHYEKMIAALREAKSTGVMGDPMLENDGDESVIETLAPIFEAAREACTVPSNLPDFSSREDEL